MSSPRIIYAPRPDTTPDSEIAVLANVYSFVLRCGEARRAEETKNAAEGAYPGGGAMKGSQHEVRASKSIPA